VGAYHLCSDYLHSAPIPARAQSYHANHKFLRVLVYPGVQVASAHLTQVAAAQPVLARLRQAAVARRVSVALRWKQAQSVSPERSRAAAVHSPLLWSEQQAQVLLY
jgi:hypothetical protein